VRVCRGEHDDAVALLAELQAILDHDDAVAAGDSFADLCRRYVDDRERLGKAPSYVVEMRRKCALLAQIPLGGRSCAEVTAGDLAKLYARLSREGLGASGIRAWHALFSGALSAAMRWGELDRNVARTPQLAPAAPRPSGEAPEPEQARRYLDAVEAASPTLGALLRLAALTGARRGELCGLRWSDLDAERATLTVFRNLTSPKGTRAAEGPTKNRRRRPLPLSDEALAELVGHRARCEMLCSLAGVALDPHGYIFTLEAYCDGSVPLRPDYVTRRSGEIADKAKLPRNVCHPHGLRHYFATRAIANGGDVVAVAAVLGQDPTITLDTYASPVDEARVAATAAVGRTLTR
jgi:integrase